MTQQIINIGSAELKGDGESIRSAFNKVNSNFTEIYGTSYTGNISFTGTIMHSSVGLQINNQGISTGATAFLTIPPDAGTNVGIQNNYGTVTITSGADPGSLKTWTFTTSGSLTAPGDVIPTVNLAYDLGSATHQWRSLYVGTSTIYIGGVPLSINTLTNTLIVGTNSNISSTSTNIATEKYVIDYVTAINTGSANLGKFKISGNNLGTVDNPDTGGWGGWDMYIDPGNGSDAFIYIPGVPNQAASTNLQISNNSTAGAIQLFGRGGVQVVVNHGVNEKVIEFADNGSIIFSDGSTQTTAYTGAGGTTSTLTAGTATLSINTLSETVLPSGLRFEPIENYGFGFGGTIAMQTYGEQLQMLATGTGAFGLFGWGEVIGGPGGVAYVVGNQDGTNEVKIVAGSYTATVHTWKFGNDGQLIIPRDILGSGDQPLVIQNTASGVAYLELPVDPSTNSVILANQAANSATVTIRVGDFGSEKDWTFNEFGALATPGYIYNTDVSNVGQLLLAGAPGEPATYLALPSDVGSTSMNVRLSNSNGGVQLYAGNNSWSFNNTGDMILPGGGALATYGYDVVLQAGNDSTSTFGSVTINTQGPPGVTNRNWEFNSLGELYLPRGGVIQETDVTNEAFGTTTTSLTLVPGGAANGTQRLEIYATLGGEGNHIHITSGDQTQTDLYLGNDTQYFAVGAMGQVEVRARPGLDSPTTGTSAYAGSPVWIYAGDAGDNGGNTIDGAPGGDVLISAGVASTGVGGDVLLYSGNGPTGYGSIKLSTNGYGNYLEFNKDGKLTLPSGGTLGPEGMGASGLSNGTSGNPVYIVNKKTNGDYLANIILTAGDGISGEISFEIWNTVTAVSKVLTINTACNLVFPDASVQNTAWVGGGSSVVQTNLIFSNDIDTRTFNNTGSVAINFTAYTGGPSFNTEWAYQSPLNDSVGITVLAATVASTATSTSTTTGALTVAGGVGIAGDLWAGNIYSNGVQLTAGGGGSGVTADSTTTFTNKTLNITLGGNDFQIQGNSIYSYSGSGPTLALTQVPTFQGFNFNDSGISGDGGTGVYYWTAGSADGTGTINKAGVLRTAGTSSNALFTFGANGAGTMSVQLDGSLFVGATLPTNSGGLNTDYPGWLVVQSGAKFGGDIDTLGRVLLNGSQFEDDSGVIDFLNVAGGAGNHIITCTSDWTLKVKARANGANGGHLWLEAGQNTKIKIHGNGSNIELIASTGTNAKTWTFASNGGITFPDATTQTTAFTGTSALIDITNTNGLTTTYYPTFVESRSNDQILRADVDLTYRTDTNTLGAGNITVTSLLNLGKAHETFTTATTASSVVNYDCANNQIFYHTNTGTVANWTANFTNLNLAAGKATAISLVIKQGNTGYYPSAVQIGGAAQTLNWQGNTNPTVNANRTDVVSFTILNDSGTYTVLGQLTGF